MLSHLNVMLLPRLSYIYWLIYFNNISKVWFGVFRRINIMTSLILNFVHSMFSYFAITPHASDTHPYPFLLNSFMAEAVIIQRPVRWFALQEASVMKESHWSFWAAYLEIFFHKKGNFEDKELLYCMLYGSKLKL